MNNTKKLNRNQKITITVKELEKIKENATIKAIDITSYFPAWVLRTKFGFGSKRIARFMSEYADLLDSYNKGYVNVTDIAQALRDEVGVEWKE